MRSPNTYPCLRAIAILTGVAIPLSLALIAQAAERLAPPHTVGPSQSSPPTEEELDAMFLVGPTAIRSMGLRTVWQSTVAHKSGDTCKGVFTPDGDSVFVVDSDNGLTRILSRDGSSIWRNSIGRATDSILGVNRIRNGVTDEVFITLDNAIIGNDAGTGALVNTNKLTQTPTTAPVRAGDYFIFGAKRGQVAWQQFGLGFFLRSNELGGRINCAPILIGNGVAVASTSGQVALLDASTTHQVWRVKLRGSVEGKLGIGADAVYAACEDHSLSALELASGNLRWRYMTGVGLTGDVFCDGELVYTQIPGEGLVALLAKPTADDATFTRDGVVKWKNIAQGSPLCRVGSRVLLWEQMDRVLTCVDCASGVTVSSVALPKVAKLAVTGPRDPDIYLLGSDGTLQRCESVARATQEAKPAASTASANPALP